MVQAGQVQQFTETNQSTDVRPQGSLLKRAVKWFMTHIGLGLLVTSYCMGGVYLFQYIEGAGERERKQAAINCSWNVEIQRQDLGELLWEYKWSPDYEDTVIKLLDEYNDNVSSCITSNTGVYRGLPLNETDIVYGWSTASAFLFTLTVVTTIGYGHVTPVTPAGQLVCIFYALVGIPLMLMFLANIGDVMAKSFRIAYGHGCCYFCRKRRLKNYELNRKAIRDLETKPKEAWTEEEREQMEDVQKWLAERDSTGALIMLELEPPEEDIINVPISLTLVVIAAYVFLGAVTFAAWDQWSWITGAYFSFVTLATIGFGDYVPGYSDSNTVSGSLKLAGSCIYIVIGLAVLSMSFNLMMEEMIAKFKWLGRKLGIIDDPNAIDASELLKNNEAPAVAARKSAPEIVDNEDDDDIPITYNDTQTRIRSATHSGGYDRDAKSGMDWEQKQAYAEEVQKLPIPERY